MNGEYTMRTKFAKLALAASIVLALAFTFGCSGGDDGGGGGNADGSTILGGCSYTNSYSSYCLEYILSKRQMDVFEPSDVSKLREGWQQWCTEENEQWYPNGCPSGWVAKCNAGSGSDSYDKHYFYSKEALETYYKNNSGGMEREECVKK